MDALHIDISVEFELESLLFPGDPGNLLADDVVAVLAELSLVVVLEVARHFVHL